MKLRLDSAAPFSQTEISIGRAAVERRVASRNDPRSLASAGFFHFS